VLQLPVQVFRDSPTVRDRVEVTCASCRRQVLQPLLQTAASQTLGRHLLPPHTVTLSPTLSPTDPVPRGQLWPTGSVGRHTYCFLLPHLLLPLAAPPASATPLASSGPRISYEVRRFWQRSATAHVLPFKGANVLDTSLCTAGALDPRCILARGRHRGMEA
jgi:hypothetical protein